MKISLKQYIIIGLFLVLAAGMNLFISSCKKQITVLGFAYKNDVIRISESKITLETIKVDTTDIDSNHVCSFYETFNYYTFGGKVNLVIEIDSGKRKVLDTLLIFTDKNKAPFVSFLSPAENRFKRTFFVGDETDKRIHRPD